MRIAIAFVSGAVAFAATLSANTIDVSSNSSQRLQNGDSLEFLFSTTNYEREAAQLGLAPNPSSLDFVFSSLPVSLAGDFTAEIESFSGTPSAAFGAPIHWNDGYIQTSQYTGVTSAITGTLSLTAVESQALFLNSYADLVLTYSGPAITVGVPGYTLPSDLTISLSGGPLSMGAMILTADYESAKDASAAYQVAGPQLVNNDALLLAPEPDSRLLFGAGITLCAVAGILKRLVFPRTRLLPPRG